MKRRFKTLRLPILAKDLLERGSRKRTYVVRFLYASTLFIAACTLFYGDIGVTAGAGQSLGRGAAHFAWIMSLQLAVLSAVVPIMTAEAIAAERQRDTLVLLLVTTLTPQQIILQKFAARTASILGFVCLSFPLLAITYTFGGVTPGALILGMAELIIACLQLGAFAILCSAYFRTTAQALAASYLGMLALRFFEYLSSNTETIFAPPSVGGAILGVLSIVGCLVMASAILVDRAFVQARNYLLEFFQYLDGIFERMNVMTGGVVLVRDRGVLPKHAPIRWRETGKKSLGTFRYLFRVLVVLEFPILFAIQWMRLVTSARGSDDGLAVLLNILWIASAALLTIHAASLISEERSHQTLNVLLSTPLSATRILDEKLAGVRRLTFVLLVPFATIFVFEQWWYSRNVIEYLVLSALTVITYLTLIEWIALAVGLRFSKQTSAIIVAVSVVAVWSGGLTVAGPLLRHLNIAGGGLENGLRALSPIDMIVAVQNSLYRGGPESPWTTSPYLTGAHFCFYISVVVLLRWWCRRNADRYLGRIPQPERAANWAAVEEAPLPATECLSADLN
jgi:ABC-type transport system involved in multi-copper enzyme maturation permease subunit